MHPEAGHSPEHHEGVTPHERTRTRQFWARMLLASGLAGAILLGASQEQDPHDAVPTTTTPIRQTAPEPSPSPMSRVGTLTVTRPDGSVEVRYYTPAPESAITPQQVHDDWDVLQQRTAPVENEPPFPTIFATFMDDGHVITLHPKRSEISDITDSVRIAVAIDGQDRSLLLDPSRESGIDLTPDTSWDWDPSTRTLVITHTEWYVHQLTYRWDGHAMALIDYDMFQPGLDEGGSTQPGNPEERAAKAFAERRTAFKKAEDNARTLLTAARAGDWDTWAHRLKEVYPSRTDQEIAQLVAKNQEEARRFMGHLVNARLDPTYFLSGRTTTYMLTDPDGNTLPVLITSGPGAASFREYDYLP